MNLGLPDKVHLPSVAANVVLAAGAVLLKPTLDSLLISGFPDSSVITFGGRIGDITYSKGLSLLEPTVGYQHYDIVAPVLKTTKPVLSSMPFLQPSSMTAAGGVMFGMTACLSLVAAGTFLVRSHAGSEPDEPGGPSSSSLSETLPYNHQQRQARNGRAAARRRGGRGREFSILLVPAILADKIHFDIFAAPDPMLPNNNQNNIPTEDIKPPAPSKSLLTNHLSIFVTDCSLH